MKRAIRSATAATAGAAAILLGSMPTSAQATVDAENRYPNVGALMVWTSPGRALNLPVDAWPWDGKRRIRSSVVRKIVDETWALWSIPSYVCSGDSGGAIFLAGRSGRAAARLVANVSDGGRDCRRHNNNNRLDTRAIQKWIDDTVQANLQK
jgi:hypothetical protein